MKIESKYTLRQKVYVVFWYYDNRPSDGHWIVEERIVVRIIICENGIYYGTNFGGFEYAEEVCFENYEDAQNVADKRNKGE